MDSFDIAVATIFPEIFHAYLGMSIMKRAAEKGVVSFDIRNIRDYAEDRHKSVDDTPYGGGPGMVMKPGPVFRAVQDIKKDGRETLTVLLTPQGRRFDQQKALALSREPRRLLLLCGRYEGIDERVRGFVDEELSAGDYVLTGGELPALIIIDAVVRLLPGALGDEHSAIEESFAWGMLDYPHYTRPPEWNGLRVPEVLLSGNHAEIKRWRRKEALRRTLRQRPDLMAGGVFEEEENKKLVREIKEEEHGPG